MTSAVLPLHAGHRGHAAVLALLAAWGSGVLALAVGEAFADPPGSPPLAILLAISVPLATFALGYRRLATVRDYVAALDLRFLIALHAWRMLGAGFLFLFAYDLLPAVFAIPAGVGDVLAAFGATVLAAALYAGRRVPARVVRAWNGFGALDFALAVAAGVLSRAPLHEVFGATVDSRILGELPLVLIPGFVVPLYLITHAIVWLRLRSTAPGVE